MPQINKVAASVDIAESDMTAASAGGDFFENDQRTRLKFKNGSGANLRVRIHEATACNFGHAITYVEETVLAGGVKVLDRTFTQARFGGHTSLTYPDGVTGLKVVAVRDGAY